MDHFFHIVFTQFWPYHQMLQHKLRLIGPENVFPVSCSYLPGSRFDMLRAQKCIPWCFSGYCCLSERSKHSGQSPLTFQIKKIFRSDCHCHSVDNFIFSDHSLQTLFLIVQENPCRLAVSLAPKTMPRLKSIVFLPHSLAQLEHQKVFLTMSACLNALSCCHVTVWLSVFVEK